MNKQPDTASQDMETEALDDALYSDIAAALTPVAPSETRATQLRERIAARVAQSAARHRGLHTFRRGDAQWQTLANGVRACVLHDTGVTRSALVEFDPGAKLPGHRHGADEECIVLRGSLDAGEAHVEQHDYHLAPAGSRHATIHSREGALAFLRGTSIGKTGDMLREVAAAWLPGKPVQPHTIAAGDAGWREIAPGTHVKTLWVPQAGETASFLLRLDPGTRLPAHPHAFEEECLMLSGEAFFGDILLREGEYQTAPRGHVHGEAWSETGALVYIHGDAAYVRP